MHGKWILWPLYWPIGHFRKELWPGLCTRIGSSDLHVYSESASISRALAINPLILSNSYKRKVEYIESFYKSLFVTR